MRGEMRGETRDGRQFSGISDFLAHQEKHLHFRKIG